MELNITRVWTGFIWLIIVSEWWTLVYTVDPSVSIISGDSLSDFQLLKTDSFPFIS